MASPLHLWTMPSPQQRAPRALLDELSQTAATLLKSGDHSAAYMTLEHGLRRGVTTAVQGQWLDLLLTVPAQQRAAHTVGAWLSVQLLGNTRAPHEVLAFAALVRQGPLNAAQQAPIFAFEAWALTRTEQHVSALALLDEVIPGLSGLAAGIAWRVRAEALFWSGQAQWQYAFDIARSHLAGYPRSLGACWLEEGSLLERDRQDAAARQAWHQALLRLDHDPYYTAWVREALGQSCLRFGLPDAEEHFLEMQRAVRKPQAQALRAQALCGLATARRAHGEWARAETGYQQAVKAAQTTKDRADEQQAWRGLGYTYRLQGKFDLALATLLRAVHCQAVGDGASGECWVQADIAAIHAQLGNRAEAARALAQTGTVTGETIERVAIVRAELARQEGDLPGAVALLGGVRAQTLWAREEQLCFPALFGLLDTGQPPLSRASSMRVEVRALGTLTVSVNQRRVPLRATGRPGELLVLLLEHGNQAPSEVLMDALYPSAQYSSARGKRRALWALVHELRQALGWQTSVQALGGVYALDPGAQWWYDVREALARHLPTPNFLAGVYQPWAVERAQQLMSAE